jgi:hypothetical protein
MKTTGMLYAVVGMALVIMLQIGCTGKGNREYTGPVKTLAMATERINRACPEMVDGDTRLDSVFLSSGGHLSYYYTLINREKSTIDEVAFKAYLIPRILNNVHSNVDLKIHRDSSVIMDFLYLDKNGEFVTEITIKPEQYK